MLYRVTMPDTDGTTDATNMSAGVLAGYLETIAARIRAGMHAEFSLTVQFVYMGAGYAAEQARLYARGE